MLRFTSFPSVCILLRCFSRYSALPSTLSNHLLSLISMSPSSSSMTQKGVSVCHVGVCVWVLMCVEKCWWETVFSHPVILNDVMFFSFLYLFSSGLHNLLCSLVFCFRPFLLSLGFCFLVRQQSNLENRLNNCLGCVCFLFVFLFFASSNCFHWQLSFSFRLSVCWISELDIVSLTMKVKAHSLADTEFWDLILSHSLQRTGA